MYNIKITINYNNAIVNLLNDYNVITIIEFYLYICIKTL